VPWPRYFGGRLVCEACVELAVDAARGDVVVINHVSPIKAAVTWALGSAMRWAGGVPGQRQGVPDQQQRPSAAAARLQ
jgi:hypothetical protein